MKTLFKILFVAFLCYFAFGCRKQEDEPGILEYWTKPRWHYTIIPTFTNSAEDIDSYQPNLYMWSVETGEFTQVENDRLVTCRIDSAFLIRLVNTGQDCWYSFGTYVGEEPKWFHMEEEAIDTLIPIEVTNQPKMKFLAKLVQPYEYPQAAYLDYQVRICYTRLYSEKIKK